MRRVGIILTGLLVFSVALFTGAPTQGGEYHRGATLICSQCHVMHGSQQHGYNPNGTGIFTPLGANPPYHYLLRNEINDLCLTCHDGGFAPDVFEVGPTGLVRQAGALNRSGGSALYPEATGHTLDSPDMPPGNDGSYDPGDHGLNCINCHHQHGYPGFGFPDAVKGSYRNLRAMTVRGPTYAIGTNDLAREVFVRTNNYSTADVDFNEPDQTASAYAAWCGNCHSNFHDSATGPNIGGVGSPPQEFLRHPVAGVNIGALTGGHSNKNVFATGSSSGTGTKLNYVKVLTATQNWKPTTAADVSDHTPSCMSCHKAHGNKNAFGLIYMNATEAGGITEQGTAAGIYQDLCRQCHVQ